MYKKREINRTYYLPPNEDDTLKIDTYNLNDELEIIEEGEEISEMIKLNNVSNASDLIGLRQMQWENNKIIENKINEIIEVINNEYND